MSKCLDFFLTVCKPADYQAMSNYAHIFKMAPVYKTTTCQRLLRKFIVYMFKQNSM